MHSRTMSAVLRGGCPLGRWSSVRSWLPEASVVRLQRHFHHRSLLQQAKGLSRRGRSSPESQPQATPAPPQRRQPTTDSTPATSAMAPRLLLLAALAAAALAPRASAADASAAACHNTTSKAECLTTDACVFCQATLVPSGCFLDSEAKLLPGCEWQRRGRAAARRARARSASGAGPEPGSPGQLAAASGGSGR